MISNQKSLSLYLDKTMTCEDLRKNNEDRFF